MGFFRSIWARVVANDGPDAAPAAGGPAPRDPAPAAPGQPPRASRDRIGGLALRSANVLPSDLFADPERVKWALLQPDVDAAARKFASLAGLGESRAAEARDAREALCAMLGADLPSERPEHIEMLLDLMQQDVREGMRRSASHEAPPPRRTHDDVPQPARAPAVEAEPAPRWADGATDLSSPEDDSGVAPEYELRVVPGATLNDADMGLVREYVQASAHRRPGSPLSELGGTEALRALKAIDGPPGRERLTVLGVLFFGAQPERLVVQSKVRFVEFPGVEMTSSGENVAYRYSEEVTGTIPQLIARMERLHKERLAPGVLADGFRVEEFPVVPLLALREAIVNAVCHRDYGLVGANIQVRLFADRLEVQSPGGLPGPVTVDNILSESYARNPRVADMLRDLGYVERHGLGIDNIVRSMAEAHLPPPEFNDCDSSFTVTLRFRQPGESDTGSWLADIGAGALAHEHQKALVFVRRVGRIVHTDYMSLNLVGESEADEHLRALVRGGWLVQSGTRGEAYHTLGPRSGAVAASLDAGVLPQAALSSLSKSQRRVLEIVVRQGRAKAGEVLEISGLKDRRTIQRALAVLTERGLVVRHASSPTDPNASYEVVPDVRDGGPAADRPS